MKGQNSKVKTDQYTNKFWLGLGEGESGIWSRADSSADETKLAVWSLHSRLSELVHSPQVLSYFLSLNSTLLPKLFFISPLHFSFSLLTPIHRVLSCPSLSVSLLFSLLPSKTLSISISSNSLPPNPHFTAQPTNFTRTFFFSDERHGFSCLWCLF